MAGKCEMKLTPVLVLEHKWKVTDERTGHTLLG